MKALGWIAVLIVATLCISYILDRIKSMLPWWLSASVLEADQPSFSIWTVAYAIIMFLISVALILVLREVLSQD